MTARGLLHDLPGGNFLSGRSWYFMNHVNMIVTDRILNESCILVKLPVHVHEALECEMQQVRSCLMRCDWWHCTPVLSMIRWTCGYNIGHWKNRTKCIAKRIVGIVGIDTLSMEWTPHWSPWASSDTVSFTFSYHTWQFTIFIVFTITTCIFSYSFSLSFWT